MEENRISMLDKYAENFSLKEYITNPAIGREKEIQELILLLLTPEKSAILVGKPGIGKTAIVEGLSYKMQRQDVPPALFGYTILNIKTAALLGTTATGESKMQMLLDELKTREKVILFIDEIHMLIGATSESAMDFANIFKEGLGRGSIKVIGATTTEEYERYILRDKAFTRRFQKVDVFEPNREHTIEIMMGTLPKIEKTTGVTMKYAKYTKELIMGFLVDLTDEYKRVYEIASRYPDVSLTLLKSAFSYAVYDNRPEVNIFDFEKAIENTKLVYPDVIKKELPKFKVAFKEIYAEEETGVTTTVQRLSEQPISRRDTIAYVTEEQMGNIMDVNNEVNNDLYAEHQEEKENPVLENLFTDEEIITPKEELNTNQFTPIDINSGYKEEKFDDDFFDTNN